jgi:hypothetical protein
MELHEYVGYDAIGLRDLLRIGEVTAAEVEEVAREALTAADAELNALALPLFSPALDRVADGPLAGVPLLIKDGGPTADGVPFGIGSRSLQGIRARYDTPCGPGIGDKYSAPPPHGLYADKLEVGPGTLRVGGGRRPGRARRSILGSPPRLISTRVAL